MTGETDAGRQDGHLLVRYRPWLDDGDFPIECRLQRAVDASRHELALRARWFGDTGRVLIWATALRVVAATTEWQSVTFPAPTWPRGCRFLRFEIVVEEDPRGVPVAVGFVQNGVEPVAIEAAALITDAGGALALAPWAVEPVKEAAAAAALADWQRADPVKRPNPVVVAGVQLSSEPDGLLAVPAEGCSLHFLHWPFTGGRPLTVNAATGDQRRTFTIVPERIVVAAAAAVVTEISGAWLPARIDIVSLRPGKTKRRHRRGKTRIAGRRVSVVVTSCGRQDLLDRTLHSFFSHNDHPIAQFIVVEDGPAAANNAIAKRFADRNITWLATGKRIGQIAAIDHAYSFASSPYIFHLEDDWEFTCSGFIAKSFAVLEAAPDCVQVWLRALWDTNHHPLEARREFVATVAVQRVRPGYLGKWCGFSFNPGLRRKHDYDRLGRYCWHTEYRFDEPTAAEATLSRIYHQLGYYAVVLADNGGNGYLRHTGFARRVPVTRPLCLAGCL